MVLSPNTPQLHYWFGKFLLLQEENADEAALQFKKAYDLDKLSVEVALQLARSYMFQHKFEDSRTILSSIKNIDHIEEYLYKMYLDTNIQIHYRIADSLASQNLLPESLKELQKMQKAFDSLPRNYKDRYMRNKLQKCYYTVEKIIRSEISNNSGLLQQAQLFKNWLNQETNI